MPHSGSRENYIMAPSRPPNRSRGVGCREGSEYSVCCHYLHNMDRISLVLMVPELAVEKGWGGSQLYMCMRSQTSSPSRCACQTRHFMAP